MGSSAIDTSFDFRTESGTRDPDSFSPTLQKYQQLLWNKPLPSGEIFDLTPAFAGSARVLRHESERGVFVLSSDTILNSNKVPLKHLYEQMPSEANAAWHRSSIGARLLFPRNRVAGGRTINQERGMNPHIRDRFDLTLEAIRRHYAGELSPLSEVLARYSDFFALFETFEGYVDFFLLNDLVDANGRIRFYLPFDSFDRSPLPTTFAEYVAFRNAQLDFFAGRSERIRAQV
jgi:hypothetical protein